MAAVLDSHAALWYLLGSPKLSAKALQTIEDALQSGEPVFLPSICLVEVIYLVEKSRLPMSALERLNSALQNPWSGIRIAPLDLAVAASVQKVARDVVPDMPDRIIAATALRVSLPLVTRDQRIRGTGIEIIW
jgi:PIN domain nuclease of toxin-antitoxin system